MQQENTMTVGQWCGQWFIANRPKWNGNTGDGYRNLIYSHILPSIGSVVLSDLTEQTITDFYDSLRSRGLGARSVWCVHLLLRRCLEALGQVHGDPRPEPYRSGAHRLHGGGVGRLPGTLTVFRRFRGLFPGTGRKS